MGSGPVNTNWGPGLVNTNCDQGRAPGSGSGLREKQSAGGRKLQILTASNVTRKVKILGAEFKFFELIFRKLEKIII